MKFFYSIAVILLYMLMGIILKTKGITLSTWQFWALMIIVALLILVTAVVGFWEGFKNGHKR